MSFKYSLACVQASSCPSSGATTTAVAAFGLPSELGDSRAVGRGRDDHDQQHCYHHAPTAKPEAVGPTTTNSTAYHHAPMAKPEAATAVVVAPDDGHEDARNMLSCILNDK